MADEDEVDVEGDFDIGTGTEQESVPHLYIDMNEPPSKSANLLPEYTQHPWMLEQGWSLDNCADEKSKAAIEKMLQEEHLRQYISGRTAISKATSSGGQLTAKGLQKQVHQRKSWTDEQRRLFLKGLESFGRSWSRIADLIPGKTTQQVKSYGQHFFKMKAKDIEDKTKDQKLFPSNGKTTLPVGICNAIRAVTTAQPTMKVSPKKLSVYYRDSSLALSHSQQHSPHTRRQQGLGSPSRRSTSATHHRARGGQGPGRRRAARGTNRLPHGRHPGSQDSLDTVRGCSTDDAGGTTEATTAATATVGSLRQASGISRSLLVDSVEVVRIPVIQSDDSDVEIDIDVNSDDSHISISGQGVGGAEEDTVYRKLVESAGISVIGHVNGSIGGVSGDNDGGGDNDDDNESNSDICKSSSESELNNESHKIDADFQPNLSIIKTEERTLEVRETTALCEATSKENQSLLNMVVKVEEELKSEAGATQEVPPSSCPNAQPNVSPSLGQLSPSPASSAVTSEVEGQGPVNESRYLEDCTNKGTSQDRGKTASTCDLMPGASQDHPKDTDQSCDSASAEEDSDSCPDEFGILTSSGEVVYLPNPTQEVSLDREVISDQEQRIHSEFFSQRPGMKTPDRYLRIRNFILDAWEKCRPQYLNKTSVRPGLKNCGDVNCIGRIHTYLEQVGAINYGCNQAQYLRSQKCVPVKVKLPKDSDQPLVRIEPSRSRKRRVRDTQGQWVDERDLEGKTIEHSDKDVEKRPRASRQRFSFDPFKLIPCREFTETEPAPFLVMVEGCAMAVMDVHAHMSKTEVIGLLGGKYDHDTSQLHINMAVPCDSLSTGMQCEMDPVSQTEACESLERHGQSVVGWYHSHPTFTPDPSCRDIETQQKYQDWFGKGGNPFVGIIVSPYCHGSQHMQSVVRCLTVRHAVEDASAIGQPYSFAYLQSHVCWDMGQLKDQLASLVNKYATYPNRVHLLQPISVRGVVTCLHKMLESLATSFPDVPSEGRGEVSQFIEDLVTSRYQVDTKDVELQPQDLDGEPFSVSEEQDHPETRLSESSISLRAEPSDVAPHQRL